MYMSCEGQHVVWAQGVAINLQGIGCRSEQFLGAWERALPWRVACFKGSGHADFIVCLANVQTPRGGGGPQRQRRWRAGCTLLGAYRDVRLCEIVNLGMSVCSEMLLMG
jgi:hypothetical protein